MGEIFWEDFLGRIFMQGIFWDDFRDNLFRRKSTRSYLNIEGIDLFVKILVFVEILYKEGRRERRKI